jgi:cyclopropane-fatty-acyl-phospholipid synthase
MNPVDLAEWGLLPDAVVRFGIRRRLAAIREGLRFASPSLLEEARTAFVDDLTKGPAAREQKRVNRQHYALPPSFFRTFLGPWRKYSCCHWPQDVTCLEEAEVAMLELTASRAQIAPGQRVLDLGCGWGSFSLWAAERYPTARFHALSNAGPQVEFIRARAGAMGLTNLTAERADVTCYDTRELYDRVVSVEMFEHIRNWGQLMGKVARWLEPDGKCFLHFFCHKNMPYLYADGDPSDWMGYHFFAGGMMPSFDLPRYFQEDLLVENSWPVNGVHYVRTLESWLRRMDGQREEIVPLLQKTYGPGWRQWQGRWRIFLMACSELFGIGRGNEWFVAHHLLKKNE